MHVHVIQPGLPSYRVDFFERVSRLLGPGFTVYHPVNQSVHDLGEMAIQPEIYSWQRGSGTYRRFPPGLAWQDCILSISFAPGDVLVIPGAPRCLSYMALLIRARLGGARIVWWGHYWSSSSRRWRFALRLALMRLSSAVLLYTDSEVEQLRAGRWWGDLRPVSALNNGIDTDRVRAHRTVYRAAERGRVMLFIGRLTAKTRLADLLAAMAHPAAGDTRLEIIGAGQEGGVFRRMAEELGVAGRVTWHGTVTDERAIAEVANRCAMFAYPGSVGLSLIHAMAYGLPTLVHDDRWRHMPEISAFDDGVTGRMFRADDPASLAWSIGEMLADPAALDRWSEACILRTTKSYNTQAMAERFRDLIESVRREDYGPGKNWC